MSGNNFANRDVAENRPASVEARENAFHLFSEINRLRREQRNISKSSGELPETLNLDCNAIYGITDCTTSEIESFTPVTETDVAGNHFVIKPDGSQAVLSSNGQEIAVRSLDGTVEGGNGSWSVASTSFSADSNTEIHLLTLEGQNEKQFVIEQSGDGSYVVKVYDQYGNLASVTEAQSDVVLETFLNDAQLDANNMSVDSTTGVMSFVDSNDQLIEFDFNTGNVGIGGFGPGHFVFNRDGSVTLPSGSVLTADGRIIEPAMFSSTQYAHDQQVIAAIQSEAQNYMSFVLGKISSNVVVTAADFSCLANCYSALGAVGLKSVAASIMQGGVGSVMDAVINQIARFAKAQELGLSGSQTVEVLRAEYTAPHAAAQMALASGAGAII